MTASETQNPLLVSEEVEVDVTLPRVDLAVLHAQFESTLAEVSEQSLTCPNCGTQHLMGVLACANCGVMFTNSGKTDQLRTANLLLEQTKPRPIGDVFTKENKAIFLEID